MSRLFLLNLILALAAAFSGCTGDAGRPLPEKELRALDMAIGSSERYTAVKTGRIDSLASLLTTGPGRQSPYSQWRLNMAIGSEFLSFNPDSAVFYYRRAISLARSHGNDSLARLAYIGRVRALSGAGIFSEAQREFSRISNLPLSQAERIQLWHAGRYLYAYMGAYAENHPRMAQQCLEQYRLYDDSLLAVLPSDDKFRRFINAERLVSDGRLVSARKELKKLLAEVPLSSNIYGMAAYQMARTYHATEDQPEYMAFLARAAISDEQGAVREGLALPELAVLLYEQGDLDRAFSYINNAIQSANRGHARMRAVALSHLLPKIDEAYRNKIKSSRDTMRISLFIAIALLAALGALLFVLERNNRKSRVARNELARVSRRQDAYIGHFLGLISSYGEKIESISSMISRKISAGQTSELLDMARSGRLTGDRNEDIFRDFDEIFLDLYPDFVAQLNMLLRPDAQVPDAAADKLSTELRIYALVRLGVSESKSISQILHLSPATVYSYRNRMRNRAMNRETFDSDIANLCRNA